jgi:hypothetical protein
MTDGLPGPVQRHLREAAGAEPPPQLLEHLAAQVRTTQQRRPLLRPFVVSLTAVTGLAAGLLLAALLASSHRTPTGVSPSSLPTSTAHATPAVSGGVPATFQGQPVYRGTAITEHIAADASASPFFVGGWLIFVEVDCMAPPSDRPTSPLAPWCPSGWFLTESRRSPGTIANQPPPLHLIVGENVPGSGWQMAVPVILRVHAHDPEAATCAAPIRTECEQAVVVEAIEWSAP